MEGKKVNHNHSKISLTYVYNLPKTTSTHMTSIGIVSQIPHYKDKDYLNFISQSDLPKCPLENFEFQISQYGDLAFF